MNINMQEMKDEGKSRLEKHVVSIAEDITEEGKEERIKSAYDYLEDALDINYIVSSRGDYKGAEVLVAFGGPNIWIYTREQAVKGYWWGDKAEAHYTDNIGLDEALEEIYQTTRQ